jgi:hypothetical protein
MRLLRAMHAPIQFHAQAWHGTRPSYFSPFCLRAICVSLINFYSYIIRFLLAYVTMTSKQAAISIDKIVGRANLMAVRNTATVGIL